MEYGILRVNKIKLNGISKAFQQHHQREASFYKSNLDIDISKIGEDVSLIHSNNFKKDIQMQLAMYHITKTPRKDAIGLIDGVITASPKFFEGKSKQAIIGFFKNAIPLIKKEFGPIISMTIHFDEKSPMHISRVFRLLVMKKMVIPLVPKRYWVDNKTIPKGKIGFIGSISQSMVWLVAIASKIPIENI